MKITEPYIPREYLALQINYCKQQLEELPEVKLSHRNIRGIKKDVLVCGTHYHLINCKSAEYYYNVLQQREKLQCKLIRLEGLWNSVFRGPPPEDIRPRKIMRYFNDSVGDSILLDSNFFNSLKHDSNPYYPEHKTHFFNGTYYRSPAEADIAMFYTEHDIPFKYEPEIWLKVSVKPCA